MNKIIEKYRDKYKNEEDIQGKFNLLNNIIKLENEQDDGYKTFVYMDIKTWFELYLKVVQNKNFSYDEFSYEKVIEKIEFVEPLLRIQLINYLIRLLKKEFFVDELNLYENYKKEQEIIILKEEKKYLTYFVKKSTKNLFTISITLILSLIFFATLWFFFEEVLKFFNTTIVSFTTINYVNYVFNLIGFLFYQNETKCVNSIYELVFFISIKLYFFLLISYFMIKEISIKVNSL